MLRVQAKEGKLLYNGEILASEISIPNESYLKMWKEITIEEANQIKDNQIKMKNSLTIDNNTEIIDNNNISSGI